MCRYKYYKQQFCKNKPGEKCLYTTRNDCVKAAGCGWCQWSLGARCLPTSQAATCDTAAGEAWHTTAGTLPAVYVPEEPKCVPYTGPTTPVTSPPPDAVTATECPATATDLGVPGMQVGLGAGTAEGGFVAVKCTSGYAVCVCVCVSCFVLRVHDTPTDDVDRVLLTHLFAPTPL